MQKQIAFPQSFWDVALKVWVKMYWFHEDIKQSSSKNKKESKHMVTFWLSAVAEDEVNIYSAKCERRGGKKNEVSIRRKREGPYLMRSSAVQVERGRCIAFNLFKVCPCPPLLSCARGTLLCSSPSAPGALRGFILWHRVQDSKMHRAARLFCPRFLICLADVAKITSVLNVK